MTKKLLFTLLLLLMAMAIFAGGLPGRTPPSYSFTHTPLSLMASYYDYMIGSYNNIPLQVANGGYLMTYHGNFSATATRRVFYSWLDASGALTFSNYLDEYGPNREGYPAMAIDPVSGAVLYAWHENSDTDDALEIRFVADQLTAGLPNSFSSYQTVVDNPISITSPEGITTTENEFLWPSLAIGPSPIPDKRRVYLLSRNAQTIEPALCSNVYLAYADFDSTDLQPGNQLNWTYRSVPLLDTWHHDLAITRGVSLALTCDQTGKLYLYGNHYAQYASDYSPINEPDIDIFFCDNYGAGTWQDLHFISDLPSWNPNAAPTDSTGFFTNAEGLPYGDEDIHWSINNSNHFNISWDHDGRLHMPALWNYSTDNPYDSYEQRELNCIKDAIFNPATQQLSIVDVYPQKHPEDTFNSCYQPWDREAPWGVEDGWIQTDDGLVPTMRKDWNYCIWDEDGHNGIMISASYNIRITNANGQGMMAMVWQNSMRAREYHYYDNPAYAAYEDASEIMISVSPDNGASWSEPISLNSVETPEMANILPLWTYSADQVTYNGANNGHSIGKLGLMFYDDVDWIPLVLPPPLHMTNLGGDIMFAELQITFPLPVANDDQQQAPELHCLSHNYPNPFRKFTSMDIKLPRSEQIALDIYNIKGQKVKSLYSGIAAKGLSTLTWDGTDAGGKPLASGIYVARLKSNGTTELKKLMLLR